MSDSKHCTGCEKRGALCITAEYEFDSNYRNTSGCFSENWKQNYHMPHLYHPWEYTRRILNQQTIDTPPHTYHIHVYCYTIANNQEILPTQVSINRQMIEENVAHVSHMILCSYKNGIMTFFKQMNTAGNHYGNKISHIRKDNHCMFSLICGA